MRIDPLLGETKSRLTPTEIGGSNPYSVASRLQNGDFTFFAAGRGAGNLLKHRSDRTCPRRPPSLLSHWSSVSLFRPPVPYRSAYTNESRRKAGVHWCREHFRPLKPMRELVKGKNVPHPVTRRDWGFVCPPDIRQLLSGFLAVRVDPSWIFEVSVTHSFRDENPMRLRGKTKTGKLSVLVGEAP